MQSGSTTQAQLAAAAAPEPEAVGVLIDFDNFAPPARGLNESALSHALQACLHRALEVHPNADSMEVRLYGGWMSGGLLSRRGSEVAALVSQIDPFPIVLPGKRILRGSLTLATTLWGDETVFDDTYRSRGAVPRLRLAGTPVPEGCHEDIKTCPARILKQFTQSAQKACPTHQCPVTAELAFVAHEQKMVDTMLACDLLEMASNGEYSGVSVVTADTDLTPPLLHAARRHATRLQLISPINNWSPLHARLLQKRRVNVIELEP